MTRVITISREYGSGGGTVARLLAERLGWKLVDDCLIGEIAKTAKIPASVIERYDESLNPWFHRIMKALWRGGYEGVVARAEGDVFDADAMASLWTRVIGEAADIGCCITVGRGGQCILQRREDAFHVSLYAPIEERIERLQNLGKIPRTADAERLVHEADNRRRTYIRRYFGQDWTNRHLYDLMICSSIGEERVVSTILVAAGLAREGT